MSTQNCPNILLNSQWQINNWSCGWTFLKAIKKFPLIFDSYFIIANTWRRWSSWFRHYIKHLVIKNKYFKETSYKHKHKSKTLKFEIKDHIQWIGIVGNTSSKNVAIKRPNTHQNNWTKKKKKKDVNTCIPTKSWIHVQLEKKKKETIIVQDHVLYED